jgi:hypothetical protein
MSRWPDPETAAADWAQTLAEWMVEQGLTAHEEGDV